MTNKEIITIILDIGAALTILFLYIQNKIINHKRKKKIINKKIIEEWFDNE